MRRTVFAPEMDAVLVAGREAKTPPHLIAAKLGVTWGAMYRRIRELGLPLSCRRRQDDDA